MLKRLIWKWLYNSIKKKKESGKYSLPLLKRYRRLMRTMSFNKATYRERMSYSVNVKTRNLGEFISTIQSITKLIEVQVHNLDLNVKLNARTKLRLDSWLVDEEQYLFDEIEASRYLLKELEALVVALEFRKKSKPPLYVYYEEAILYIVQDLIDAIDALIALNLGVNDVKRHAPDIIIRR